MQRILEFKDTLTLTYLTQEKAKFIDILEKELNINVKLIGNHIILIGNDKNVKIACQVLSNLNQKIIKDNLMDSLDIENWLKSNILRKDNKIMEKIAPELTIKTKKRHISPRSAKQADYIKMINDKELTFGLGPAGTGKTYLAVAKAVEMMINGEVDKIILTRPAVEAGENLGFLPGDLKEKIDPYLRPLYDALYDMMPADMVDKKIEFQEIEIAPLAYMRGRTLSNAAIILDEAQNTTPMQMKMFLTRLGENSKMVVNGDLSQTDLPPNTKSGLKDAYEILKKLNEVGMVEFDEKDVVRHGLVSKIVKAYDDRKRIESK